jgi:hypothetical protein
MALGPLGAVIGGALGAGAGKLIDEESNKRARRETASPT